MKKIVLWQSKRIKWRYIYIIYGIRNSEKSQWVPIWNTSNNCQYGILVGFGKVGIEIGYRF